MRDSLRNTILGISLTASIIVLQGCKPEEIDVRQTELIQGLLYKLRDTEPFTGKVNNIAGSYLVKVMEYKRPNLANYVLGNYSMYLNSPNTSCEANFAKGLVDGKVTCTRSGEIVYRGTYKKGIKEGDEEFIAILTDFIFPQGSSTRHKYTIRYKSHWRNGIKDGLEQWYSYPNQTLVASINWKAGKKDKKEKITIEDKELKIQANLNWNNGKLVNGYERLKNNKAKQEIVYHNGLEQRTETDKIYDYMQRRYTKIIIAEIQGNQVTKKLFNGNNQLEKENKFIDGHLVNSIDYTTPKGTTETPIKTIDISACVDKVIAAYREEMGEEALITVDHLTEIENNCKK